MKEDETVRGGEVGKQRHAKEVSTRRPRLELEGEPAVTRIDLHSTSICNCDMMQTFCLSANLNLETHLRFKATRLKFDAY